MKWVQVENYYYNAEHIVEFQWSMGKLYIWDDSPVTENVIENVVTFDDRDRKKYEFLCFQLGISPIC